MIINLLGNALKFIREGGHIRVELHGDGNEVCFKISDDGPGIAPQDFKKIFDKFERAAFAGKVDGAGLGLPIAKDIVELHKGRIWVESEQGKGATFIFTLPKDFRAPGDERR